MKRRKTISDLYRLHEHHESTMIRATKRWLKTRDAIRRLEKKADRDLLGPPNGDTFGVT